jgi:HSP20 family molecular chaperone IbpA
MYLHHLTASREAGEQLERFFRWARGKGRTGPGGGPIPTTVLRSDGHIAIRVEVPDAEVDDIRVDGNVVVVTMTSRKDTGRNAV